MKKLVTLFAVAFVVIGSAVAQMAIPGEIFAQNPARFNGRKVTLKNIELVKADAHGGPAIGGPAGSFQAAPGAVGTQSAPTLEPCRPPRGYSEVEVFFKGAPEFKACFFMVDMMKTQLDRELGMESKPAQITLRGDARTGYMVTFFRLGN